MTRRVDRCIALRDGAVVHDGPATPADVLRLKLVAYDHPAWVICTPEYNASYPALLKNTLDWISSPVKHDPAWTDGFKSSRGKVVVGEFLGDVRPAVWISDRLGAQRGWATRDHQVCLAHLLRDVQYAIDAGDSAFAPGVKHLLQRAVRIGHRRPALADATLAAYHARLQRTLDDLLKIVPDNKPGLKLQRIIKRFRQNLFVFLTDREVSPTNNGSEQALRPCVIFRKITNGFRSLWGAGLYADVRSVLETARRRGVGILHALRLTLNGQPLPTAA